MENYGYYSKLLKKPFDKLEDLRKAEAEYKQKNEAALKLAQEKKERAAEIDAAWKAYVEAGKHYDELVNKFVKDYNSYHSTKSAIYTQPESIIETLLNAFRF